MCNYGCHCVFQVFLEPGEDTGKFDSLAPIVVKPATCEMNSSGDSDDVFTFVTLLFHSTLMLHFEKSVKRLKYEMA